MLSRELLTQVGREVRPGHPAGGPARRPPPVRLRRAGRAQGHLPAHLPRPGRPLRHQHRRWTTGPSRQVPGRARLRLRPGPPALQRAALYLPADNPRVDSISDVVPGASWAEREMRDLVGIEPVGHRYLKRLVLPDGWPDGVHPLRKDVPWNQVPDGLRRGPRVHFDEPPEGCTVVPLRAVPPHAGRAGAFPALRRRRDGARLRVPRVHGASRASRSSPSRSSPTTTSR